MKLQLAFLYAFVLALAVALSATPLTTGYQSLKIVNSSAIFSGSSIDGPVCKPYFPETDPKISIDDCMWLVHYKLSGAVDVDTLYTWSWDTPTADKQLKRGDGMWEQDGKCEIWVDYPEDGGVSLMKSNALVGRKKRWRDGWKGVGVGEGDRKEQDSFSIRDVADAAGRIIQECLISTTGNNGGSVAVGNGKGFVVEVGLMEVGQA